jgi:hypothetical protein
MSGDMSKGNKKLMVLVTSMDGHLRHPFDRTDTVGIVHRYAYDKLVKQKDAVPFERTWIEHNGQRTDDMVLLETLVNDEQHGAEPDLTLALSWDTGGGGLAHG